MIHDAMMNIEFNFSQIGQDEMKVICGGAELKEEWNKTISNFTQI